MDLDEPIHVQPYDPAWPDQFACERTRIMAVIPDVAVAICHFGSTAVPGMLAKPIVDILVGVDPWSRDDPRLAPLTALGYEAFGEAGVPRRLYWRKRAATGHYNLAVVAYQGPLWHANLALRDHLRTHPDDAARYAALKQEIVASGVHRLLEYSACKAAFLSALLSKLSPSITP